MHTGDATHPARPRILLVEDNPVDQQIMLRVLRRVGMAADVHVADTIGAAREVIAAHRIAHMFLDNTLPDGHGANFILELAASGVLQSLPVTLVTDWPSPFMFEKAKRAGVRAVIQKAEFRPDRIRGLLGPPAVT